VELCFVFAGIAILMGLLLAAVSSAQESVRRGKAKTDLLLMVSAVHTYHTDYEAYPVSPELRRTEVTFATCNSDLLNALRAVPDGANAGNQLNPRQVSYLQLPAAADPRHPRSGVCRGCWYDPWGPDQEKPESGVYHVRIAAPGREQVTNPYPGGDGGEKEEKEEESEENEEPTVNTDVIAWSLGKGGVQTYELRDQIISWR
jgi:hypothetical protein